MASVLANQGVPLAEYKIQPGIEAVAQRGGFHRVFSAEAEKGVLRPLCNGWDIAAAQVWDSGKVCKRVCGVSGRFQAEWEWKLYRVCDRPKGPCLGRSVPKRGGISPNGIHAPFLFYSFAGIADKRRIGWGAAGIKRDKGKRRIGWGRKKAAGRRGKAEAGRRTRAEAKRGTKAKPAWRHCSWE